MTAALNSYIRKLPAWLLYIVLPLPAIWWFWLALNNQLGPEPINALERLYGEFALQLLVAGLAITPLMKHAKLNLVKFRRAIGLMAFFYVAIHLAVWLILDVGVLSQIWTEIVKRPYVTVGMASFLLAIPLAVTSNNLSLRKLGPVTWRRIHKLTYAVCLLGGVHFLMIVKGFQWEPLIYLGLIVGLLALRWAPNRKRRPAAA